MKNLLLSFGFLSIVSISAQTLPVEQLNEVTGNVSEQIEGITHIRDVNGVLNKFEGTWKATFSSGELEIVIKKYTRDHSLFVQSYHPDPLFWDELIGKYKITDQNGVVKENTLDLPDDSLDFLIKHKFYDESTYTFDYLGAEHKCGDNGYLILWHKNDTTIHLKYAYKGERSSTCSEQAEKSLPINTILILNKQ